MRVKPTIRVVAAVIERDGRILIGQRRRKGRHAFKWEFPGGKVEPGETPEEALRRELREELEIEAEIGDAIRLIRHQYPGRSPIEIIFFTVRQFTGDPQNLAFEQIEWTPRNSLPGYDFVEADIEFVRQLAE